MRENLNGPEEIGIWTINHEKEKKIAVTHVNVRKSIVFLIGKLLASDIIATVFVLVFFSPIFFPLPAEIKAQIISYNVWYFLLLILGKIILTFYIVLAWLNEYYEITPSKIFYRRGIILRREDSYDLSRGHSGITSIGIKQSAFGRIFNYGTLFFYDRGTYKYYYLYYIHNPMRYFEILRYLLPAADVEKEVIRERVSDKETVL